jgi:hypothetical protein
MKIRLFRIAAIAVALLISPAWASALVDKPMLVVQITADQLRGDLLERYRSVLTDGFARIENGGYWIRRGEVDHGLTLSFPGHATLATGMYPSHHGLTANEWWENQKGTWGEVDVSADDRFSMLDAPVRHGPSPHNMTATTLGEWVKASDPRSKSVALGTGNPIPVAYGGKQSDAVYWFDESSGKFTSSTYYSQTMTAWVSAFNASQLPKYEKQTWTLGVPPFAIGLANPDATPYENHGRFNTFPHFYALESVPQHGGSTITPYPRWFARTPLKDEAGIIVRFKENMVFDAATGIHGSPYAAERLIPIIFYGMNIKPGSRDSGGRTVDVAPTLAAAAQIASPAGLDGVVLSNIVRSNSRREEIPMMREPQ